MNSIDSVNEILPKPSIGRWVRMCQPDAKGFVDVLPKKHNKTLEQRNLHEWQLE